MLQWTEQIAVGHDVIDTQHRMLIDYINQLEGVKRTTNPNRKQCEFIITLVNFLESYVDAHFQMEEKCMESYKCPAHETNKSAHREFKAFFRHFKERYAAEGFRVEVLEQLHQSASSWIVEHIMTVDMQLKPCLKHD
jgi:hemerythrin-like metal-binding protein